MLDLIQTRRDLHQIPEIGLEEFKTHAYLLDVIEKIDCGQEFCSSSYLADRDFGLFAGKSTRAYHWLENRY